MSLMPFPNGAASGRGIDFVTLEDFTGGLNLRDNTHQLADNESPDLLNVDMDARGGFRLRGGVNAYGAATAADPLSVFMYERTSAATYLVHSDGTNVKYRTGGTWTTVTALSGTVRYATFKDRLYMTNGTDALKRWDGSTVVTLGDASSSNWNDNIETPTASGSTGNAPICNHLAVHRGVLWAAGTTENGTAYPNRVRWSHPNFPEDWFERHFIDVDTGLDGDVITAIQPMGDHLLVFKNRSVHAIYGAPPEQFEVYPVNTEIGAVSADAVVGTDNGVFFFSWPDGLFRYDGKSFDWTFENMYPMIQQGDVDGTYSEEIQLGWGNRRLWLSVPWQGSPTRSRVFVMDPMLSKGGSWTQYDLALGPFLEYKPAGEEAVLLASVVGGTQLVQVDQYEQQHDDFGAGPVHIESYYRTRWYDLGTAAMKKRWKRPSFVLRGGTTGTVIVDGFKNYDITVPTRHFELRTTADSSAATWGTSVWGTGVWGRDIGIQSELQRGSQLGNAYSVALRFNGPSTNVDWGIDAINMKFVPRKVRN